MFHLNEKQKELLQKRDEKDQVLIDAIKSALPEL
jgi:hypothetical protein